MSQGPARPSGSEVYDNCVGVPKCSERGLREGRWGIKGQSLTGLKEERKVFAGSQVGAGGMGWAGVPACLEAL